MQAAMAREDEPFGPVTDWACQPFGPCMIVYSTCRAIETVSGTSEIVLAYQQLTSSPYERETERLVEFRLGDRLGATHLQQRTETSTPRLDRFNCGVVHKN